MGTDDPRWKPGAAEVDSSYAATPLTHRVTNVGNGLFRLLAISVKDNAPVVHAGELPGRLEATSSWFRWSRVELAAGQATPRLDEMSIEEVEAFLIKKTLARCNGNARQAAEGHDRPPAPGFPPADRMYYKHHKAA